MYKKLEGKKVLFKTFAGQEDIKICFERFGCLFFAMDGKNSNSKGTLHDVM